MVRCVASLSVSLFLYSVTIGQSVGFEQSGCLDGSCGNQAVDAHVGDHFGGALPLVDQGPKFRFVFDGLLLDRSDSLDSHTLLWDAPFPAGNPLLDASELSFDTIFGGRLELTLFDEGPNPVDYRFGYMFTETASLHEARSSSPADINFFNASAANPSDTYTARYEPKLWLTDLSLRRRYSKFGTSAGLSFGQLRESFDLLSSFDPLSGFYSRTDNELYGIQLGADGHLWSNGFSRIEGSVTGGVYYNDIEIQASALGVDRIWDDSETSFVGSANIAWVIPAFPFNFRIGYQAYFLSGVALAPDQSQQLSFFSAAGEAVTNDVLYHGAILGIEFVH